MRHTLTAALLVLSASAAAQTYPTGPVRVVVPFPPGGGNDSMGRILAQKLTESMGKQFVIDNRGGANGMVGSELVAKAPKDGYTLLVTNCAHSSNPAHYKKLPYDTLTDFAPVTQTNFTYGNFLTVHPSLPSRSVKEFIALAKAHPGKLNYASAGVGSPPHVTGALFAAMAGIKLTHVAYKGTSVAFNDVLGGHIEVMFSSPPFTAPFIAAGKVRALGIAGPIRSPHFPDIPTFDESGLTGYNLRCYHGLWFPAGTSGEIVRRLRAEVVKALAAPEVRKHYFDNDLLPVGSTPEEFQEFLAKDIARQISIAKTVGLTPQ